MITGTPIKTRIRKQKYEGIEQLNSYEYVYWRMDHPIDLFITQLEDNLIKKYNDYFGSSIERQQIFERCKFMKQVSTRLSMGVNHPKQATLIGTTWEFFFDEANPLIQFALDIGLGELGSMGFGFMKLARNNIRLQSTHSLFLDSMLTNPSFSKNPDKAKNYARITTAILNNINHEEIQELYDICGNSSSVNLSKLFEKTLPEKQHKRDKSSGKDLLLVN